jgi:predicted transcriptional regulator
MEFDPKAAAQEARRRKEVDEERKGLDLSENEFNEYLKLRDSVTPSLYDINLMMDDFIVGEEFNRLSVFTVHILSDGCVYVSGDSGAGKTQLMEAVSKTMLPGSYLMIGQGSDKAIYEKAYQIKKCTHVAFPELNKIANNPNMIEMMKSWGEGKNADYDRSKMGNSLQHIELPCRPFIFSRATESSGTNPIPGELYTRVAEFTVDSSRDQTRAVMHRVAEDVENPFDIKRIDKVQSAAFRYYVSNLPKFDYYINPAAGCLVDGITRFYNYDRVIFDRFDSSCIMVAPVDVFYNHIIFGKTLIKSAMRCNEVEKTIIKLIESNSGLTKQEVHAGLRTNNINTTMSNVATHLASLTDIGYLMSERDGRENVYYITDFYKEFEVQPDFNRIVDYMMNTVEKNPHYDEISGEYIEKYCDKDNIIATDPFTGETINVMEYEFGSINDVKVSEASTRMAAPRPQQQGLDAW